LSSCIAKMTHPFDDTACRLCQGPTVFAYKTVVLAKYEVSYYRCQQCGSLQSEQPYWLAESYREPSASIDTGSARRVLDNYVLVDIVARLFGCRRLLDFGGNSGFLCRLLRDRGYDAYAFDQYVAPIYVPHFVGSPSEHYDLVSAFEVIEHFPRPAEDLKQIFGARPRIVVATTELFCGQSVDWWYLAPLEGQHVFFYSQQAAQLIAARYGYHLLITAGFLIFSRDPLTLAQKALVGSLKPRIMRVIGALLLMRRGHGAEADAALLTRNGTRRVEGGH
jgi:hypothetical protein